MQKTSILFVILLTSIITSFAQPLTDVQKLSSLARVWGFLKYYHPVIAKGKYNWDAELIKEIPLIRASNNKEELSSTYIKWINSFGKVKLCKSCRNIKDIPDSLKRNLDLEWLNDSTTFTPEFSKLLIYIRDNHLEGRKYYVRPFWFIGAPKFKNELTYPEMIYPEAEYRLLCLFRYWNFINYFYPYKYAIGKDWKETLNEMISKFDQAKDTTEYHLAITELVANVYDGHERFGDRYTAKHFGLKIPPFYCKIIDSLFIVESTNYDSLCKIDDIKIGDVITKFNNKKISERLKEEKKYMSGSNDATILRNFYPQLSSDSDTCQITFIRNDIERSKFIHLYSYKLYNKMYYDNLKNKPKTKDSLILPYKELQNNIGYVDMGKLYNNQVSKMMKLLMKKKAIIFDVRNYPNGTMYNISNYLNPHTVDFAKFTTFDKSFPGVIKYDGTYIAGSENKNYYKGKVIILCNEWTQSHAEFTCMALQTAPSAKIVGSQTAGADGNVVPIYLPGNIQFYMTGLGVYYPDGRETQRVGIVPDIVVKPTIKGVVGGKDEVLDRAIEFIETGK